MELDCLRLVRRKTVAKRGNSEGSKSKRPDGRYEARVTLPDGKRKSFYGKTRQEANQKLCRRRRLSLTASL